MYTTGVAPSLLTRSLSPPKVALSYLYKWNVTYDGGGFPQGQVPRRQVNQGMLNDQWNPAQPRAPVEPSFCLGGFLNDIEVTQKFLSGSHDKGCSKG